MKICTLTLILLLTATTLYSQLQVHLSEASDVANPVNYPLFAWYPDGHISVVPDEDGYIMFWAEYESHRSVGTSQFVEDQQALVPTQAVFGGRGNFDTYDNGGAWLMSVFRQEGDNFIGFYHAEDHWYPHTTNDIAWKSIGVVYSEDEGKSWTEGNQIITSATPKPDSPAWGGTGDNCVVWDHINNRWMCYFQEHQISMAISTDPDGAPGTWQKYYQGEFSQDGLGGLQSVLPGLEQFAGGNPSVHWNTYLSKWVMVWHRWAPAVIYIAVSDDGVNWENGQSIIVSEIGGRAWYPTIIGNTDVEAGQIAKIYYADIAADFSYRNFKVRTITFIDPENPDAATGRIDHPANGSTISSGIVEIKASVENIQAEIEKVEFYSNGILVGTDTSFPFGLEWIPTETGSYAIKAVFTDNDGTTIESAEVTIDVDNILGLNDFNLNDDFLIYPSPSNGNLVIAELPLGQKVIRIFNSGLKLVHSTSSEAEKINIDISNYAQGIYYVNVLSDNQSFSRKILKL